VEPSGSDARHTKVHVDIPGLHGLAAAHARHATALDGLAADLRAVAPGAGVFGPTGTRFVAALIAALDREADTARSLGARIASAAETVRTVARTYGTADERAGTAVDAASA
jgi:hypothetical protein